MEAAERDLEESASAFIVWAARHDIDINDRDDVRLVLRMEGIDRVSAAIREGFELWKEAGMDPMRYRQARVYLGDQGDISSNSICSILFAVSHKIVIPV